MDAELEFAIQQSTTGKQLFDQVPSSILPLHSLFKSYNNNNHLLLLLLRVVCDFDNQ